MVYTISMLTLYSISMLKWYIIKHGLNGIYHVCLHYIPFPMEWEMVYNVCMEIIYHFHAYII